MNINKDIVNITGAGKRLYAVMMFETARDLGVSEEPELWVNTRNYITDNGLYALNIYADTPCPASQLVEADQMDELEAKMGEMIINFTDKKWLNEHLYPYI